MGYFYVIKYLYNWFSFLKVTRSISRPFSHYHRFLNHNNLEVIKNAYFNNDDINKINSGNGGESDKLH